MSQPLDLLDTLKSIAAAAIDPNCTESDTRARLIDPMLAALGWLPEDIRREPYDNWTPEPGYLDYLLLVHGQPYVAIEAKKTSTSFDLPDRLQRTGATTLAKLQLAIGEDALEAINQAIRYAEHSGAPYACATNGRQYLFLKPSHRHRPRRDARIVVFATIPSIVARLDEFEALLARHRVSAGSPEEVLIGRERVLATFSRRFGDSPSGGPSENVESKAFAELADHIVRNFLIDITDEQAFHRCYVPVSWTQSTDDALAALLTNQVRSIARAKDALTLDDVIPYRPLDALVGAPRGRSVVLHGPIGIGKTSYLRHLLKTESVAATRRGRAIWARIDLLEYRLRPFQEDAATHILSDLSSSLRTTVADAAACLDDTLDPEEWRHLRDIYMREATRFRKERYPDSDDHDQVFIEALRAYIFQLKEKDPRDHFIRTVAWLTKKCNVPVVVTLDNSDQLGLAFQEYLYDLSTLLDQHTAAVTIICLRTEALLSHRIKENALARVEERYEITRPPLVRVLRARLDEVERALRPKMASQKDPNYQVAFDRIWALLLALRNDLDHRGPAALLVEMAGNGNLRRTLQAVGKIFKESPKMMDNLVRATAEGEDRVRLDPSFVLRGILRGSSGRYDSSAKDNLIPNLFAVDRAIREPHTLSVYLLRHIWFKQQCDEAPMVSDVTNDLAAAGIDPELVRKLLFNCRRKEVLATSHMFDEIALDDRIRVTSLGEGMLKDVFNDPDYLDAVLWDTVIYDEATFRRMTQAFRVSGRRRYDDLRDVFVQYLQRDDLEFRAAHALELLPPEAWGAPLTFPFSDTPRQRSFLSNPHSGHRSGPRR